MDILSSMLIGIAISAIPGPIFFEIVRRVLIKNFWSGFFVSIGDFIGNLSLLLLIFFGINSFLTITIVQIILFFIGGLILIWLGINAFRVSKHTLAQDNGSNYDKSSILVGLSISISSPIVIMFWIALSGSYLSQFENINHSFLNILAIAIGFVFFHFILSSFISITKRKIPPQYIIHLSKLFGIILLVYGAHFFITAIQLFS